MTAVDSREVPIDALTNGPAGWYVILRWPEGIRPEAIQVLYFADRAEAHICADVHKAGFLPVRPVFISDPQRRD